MELQIKGFIETSFEYWKDRISSVIFLGDCNCKCAFCHTPDLVLTPHRMLNIPWSKIKAFLDRSKGWVDGVVITGGEPTIHNTLPELCRRIKEMGYAIRLETNGTNSEMIRHLIEEGLVQYIAMDIKALFEGPSFLKIHRIENRELLKNVQRSAFYLQTSSIDYEFRTTIVPNLYTRDDIEKIAFQLKRARRYVLRYFKPGKTIDPIYQNLKPLSASEMRGYLTAARKYIKNAELEE